MSEKGGDSPLAPGVIQVQLFGRPRWRAGHGPWTGLSAPAAALIAVLALEGPQGRDALAGRLWPQGSDKRAGNNLRKQVSRLREVTGHQLFETGPTLSLLASVCVQLRPPVGAAGGPGQDGELLAGCDFAGNEFLYQWVQSRREALRVMRADELAGQAEALERNGELVEALRLAQQVIDLTPAREMAWRRLMRLHYLRGDHTAAIEVFERFETLLREDTGARPGPETLRLLATIERGAQAQSLPQRRVPVSLVRPPHRVGREAQWLAMQRAWAGGRAFMLIGEAGIGKSRLLDDFVQGRADVLHERARPGDAQGPYTLLVRLLRAVLPRPGVAPGGFVRQQLARLMPELGPVPLAPAQESEIRHAAERLLTMALASGVAALVIDDLHHADLASLETLRWLCASTGLRDLRVGLATRPPADTAIAGLVQGWALDSQRPEQILLHPLQPAEVVDLLAAIDLPEFADAALAARLHVHAGGQLLFTLETLKDAWLHGQDLRSGELPRPQTVQALLEGRLRQLPSEALDLVRVAAVAGADLNLQRAAQLLGANPLALADAWSLLERANVLQGDRFAHDLLHECALGLVPQALRRALHAVIAELLAADPAVPAGRVADHWQRAQRWAEAGLWWQRAGLAARQAGRLQEQQQLLERAAACHRQAGHAAGEFEAVCLSFDSVLLRHGGNAVLAALPRLEALASTDAQRLECRLIQAEALLDVEQGAEALDAALAAVTLAQGLPRRVGDALCLQGMALARLGRTADAVQAAQEAAAAAQAVGDPAQELRAVRAMAYALFTQGRLAAALPEYRRVAQLAHTLGDEAEGAAAEASVAALQALTGEVPASFALATRAAHRYEAMGLDQNSTLGAANLVVCGASAAYLGRYSEALPLLERAVRMAGDQAVSSAQAKARITLASVQLLLGDSGAARQLVQAIPSAAPPGMRMAAALLLARAEQAEGGTGQSHLARLGRLGAEHPDLPLIASDWVEWSHQGETAPVLAKLQALHAQFMACGLRGSARTVKLRLVARLLDRADPPDVALAAVCAHELADHINTGMSAKVYPPEAWMILARAFERAGELEAMARSRRAALCWIQQQALPWVPAPVRDAFLRRNPVNRAVLEAAA